MFFPFLINNNILLWYKKGDFMNYNVVQTEQDINNIEMMASIIWPIAYKDILEIGQIKYMLEKYLSAKAIKNNISDHYTYLILEDEAENAKIGFMAYNICNDKLFLSKLYILPNMQNKGYATQAINYLKNLNLDIELTVNKNNKNAYEKYIHLGFKNIDSVVTDIGNGYVMDDYILRLEKEEN